MFLKNKLYFCLYCEALITVFNYRENNMYKKLALLLSLMTVTFSLTACSPEEKKNNLTINSTGDSQKIIVGSH